MVMCSGLITNLPSESDIKSTNPFEWLLPSPAMQGSRGTMTKSLLVARTVSLFRG
jgi:hypothetical protein